MFGHCSEKPCACYLCNEKYTTLEKIKDDMQDNHQGGRHPISGGKKVEINNRLHQGMFLATLKNFWSDKKQSFGTHFFKKTSSSL